ncbi:hypothetical protein [Streptomyces spectabilis]|uniref:Uncharacterized protein n=1 Tax=Streptomyces spectabilis TaxID=68270 RepID=A0A5P2X632_STRST|nr:hypothetical protein [Streptomyces spectabilis]MBB5108334.1 hypothetical protein [Streptomyces spectabilis]MCI3901092.1 hypothetical protein [Streptomyces spectabilis]QEV58585.1 hypothetical protein CP982_07540 [Streptomyces spectabilis]GGV45922.1 hypothetical protein GCM10010245_71960 [Streptomyces spectabilis]
MTRDYGGEDSADDEVHRLIEARDYHRTRQLEAEGSGLAEVHGENAARCQGLAEESIRRGRQG